MSSLVYTHKLPCGVFETYNSKPNFQVLKCHQIHSAEILPLEQVSPTSKADGICSSQLQQPLAVVTADCLPIALCGAAGVALVHAGWRGLAGNILAHERIKSLNPTYALIGPHISADNYEVQPDFLQNFPNGQSAFIHKDEKIFFSQEIEAKRQLAELYGPITIESSNICTFNNSELHSYRENQTSLRNWNVLRME